MQVTQSKIGWIAISIAMVGMVGGCHSKEKPKQAAASPSADKSGQNGNAASSEMQGGKKEASPGADVGGKYRVRVVAAGNSGVAFSVAVNGQDAGSFNTSVTSDITPLIRPGRNEIEATWTSEQKTPASGSSQIIVEQQREGSGTWNTLFSREVKGGTGNSEAKGAFTAGSKENMSSMAAAGDAATFTGNNVLTPTPAPAAPSSAPSPVAAPESAGNLTDQYVVKVATNAMAPGQFVLVLNGQEVGSFNASANQDITAYLHPGKNVAVIKHSATKAITNQFAQTTFTVGVQRNGKWSTVANQAISKDQPRGEKNFVFYAK